MADDEHPFNQTNPPEVSHAAFPRLLMTLLNEQVAPGALWWLPDGKGFVLNPKEAPSKLLDTYFRATKFSSFIRRLHNT
jgi:HSF-type DNA-binding